MSQIDVDGPQTSENSSQQTLTIKEKNEIFLKSTETDDNGNPFGLGKLKETINKGKIKESYGNSQSSSISEIDQQLQAARQNIEEQEAENARRDAENRVSQSKIASLEFLLSYFKTNDPAFAAYVASQSDRAAPTTTPGTTLRAAPPTTAGTTPGNAPPTTAGTTERTSPTNSPLSNTSSTSPS
ncbi:G8 domain-containing protein DDB_G0286311-like [Eutrema salsugineum]|uniref:G8 domain-containing protein DDB_G0286311-like n=1 Tax=Eutrema salsugineum TaxID=72664 RepID=UPI000CED70A0|nr:G8 domain-containing protein DDB_G0286311-like [Eutrema salsugineum]